VEASPGNLTESLFSSFQPTLSRLSTSLPSGHVKELSTAIASGDASKISSTLMKLSSELSMMQDSSIPSYSLDQLVSPLIKCAGMDAAPDVICIFLM